MQAFVSDCERTNKQTKFKSGANCGSKTNGARAQGITTAPETASAIRKAIVIVTINGAGKRATKKDTEAAWIPDPPMPKVRMLQQQHNFQDNCGSIRTHNCG